MKFKMIYCAVCGGQIFNAADLEDSCESEWTNTNSFEDEEWLTRAALLTTGHYTEHGVALDDYALGRPSKQIKRVTFEQTEPPSRVLDLPAMSCGKDAPATFQLLGRDERVGANSLWDDIDFDGTITRPLYIAIHQSCLAVTKMAIQAYGSLNMSSVSPLEPISIDKLWDVLRARLSTAMSSDLPSFSPVFSIHEPHNFYGQCFWRYLDEQLDRPDPEEPNDEDYFYADPMAIPRMTESILRHLEPLKSGVTSSAHLSTSNTADFAVLPQEVLDLVTAQLHPFTNPSLECNCIVPPKFWRRALVHGTLLPWLGPLSADEVARKEDSKPQDTHSDWNWELLVRQLAQSNLHEPGKHIPDLAPGLRNRRRIWKLLEVMRVGDLRRK